MIVRRLGALAHMHIDWALAANIATVVSCIIVTITIVFGVRQLVEMKRATFLSVVTKILDILQDEETRRARSTVLATLRDRDLQDWNDTEIDQAEKVCHSYNTAARLLRFTGCPTDPIVEPAKDSIVKTWAILKPLVLSYRAERGTDFWSDYEWLASKASEKSPNTAMQRTAPRSDA
jgi:hypothetical protein